MSTTSKKAPEQNEIHQLYKGLYFPIEHIAQRQNDLSKISTTIDLYILPTHTEQTFSQQVYNCNNNQTISPIYFPPPFA